MSGGRLVVLDRQGRDVKSYSLPEGMATLGSGPNCDIRVLLASIRQHHSTVAVHANQTIIRNVGDGVTLVNGTHVSVAALQHGDIITLGDRSLRWEYTNPNLKRQRQIQPAFAAQSSASGSGGTRGRRAGRSVSAAGPGGGTARDRELQLAIELSHRASMPGGAGGKQVAVVQPQRRDAVHQAAQGSTKAAQWIESRKSSPRRSGKQQTQQLSQRPRRSKSTPLRMAVLRKAQSAHNYTLVKIQPVKIDQTKQAALLLMTGHTPKPKPVNSKGQSPSYVVKKRSPRTPQTVPRVSARSKENVTPRRAASYHLSTVNTATTATTATPTASASNRSALGTTDTPNQRARQSRQSLRASRTKSSRKTPSLTNPRKSALRDPKRSSRKTDSIKFDLSNLSKSQESFEGMETTTYTESNNGGDDSIAEDITLHYSESSTSPSPRRPIHSRSSRILEKCTGVSLTYSPTRNDKSESPNTKRLSRGSLMVQKALETSASEYTLQSAEESYQTPTDTRRVSPRANTNLESYSIVDLVSRDSVESQSMYNSAASTEEGSFGTPQPTRKTRSTLGSALLCSSTPYVAKSTTPADQSPRSSRSHSNIESYSNRTITITDSTLTRTETLTTPENTRKHIASLNSSKLLRPPRNRSRLNDSDLIFFEDNESDVSPRSSKRISSKYNSAALESNAQIESAESTNVSKGVTSEQGTTTPENQPTVEEAGTPVLRIQSLLDSSRNAATSHHFTRNRISKRKSLGVAFELNKRRIDIKSRSLNMSTRRSKFNTTKGSSSSENSFEGMSQKEDDKTVTPKSSIKLVPEAVKNKHSTAKKPQSKRSIIDDLNQSDIVKQLFNSPVKRKLSQSMIEFSRKFGDDDLPVRAKRRTRNTIAVFAGDDTSLLDQTQCISPELFVSPVNTPQHSPNLSRVKRLFAKTTPENDLTNVSGVKSVFARSPANRLSDVRVKNLFTSSPTNDLRRVTGVPMLFKSQQKSKGPKNDLSDVRGVRELFKNKPKDDLTNFSRLKSALQIRSPRNDLTNVRGVRDIFRVPKLNAGSEVNISGVRELFEQSLRDKDALFDQLIGKPQLKSIYSKTYSSRSTQKRKKYTPRSVHRSLSMEPMMSNVEDCLQKELQTRVNREAAGNTSIQREMKKLATATVEGSTPVRATRVRESTVVKVLEGEERRSKTSLNYSQRKLPIKKRSLMYTSVENNELSSGREQPVPIKKRRLAHSTPVKSHLSITACELSRVSPIDVAAGDITRAQLRNTHRVPSRTPVSQTQKSSEQVQPRSRTTKHEAPKTKEDETPKHELKSPKKTRARVKILLRTPVSRATRNKKGNRSNETETTRKSRSSLVLGKKTPVSKPGASKKTDGKAADVNQDHAAPKIATRKQERSIVDQVKSTPKMTRARIQKTTVAISKPSPVIKPQSTKKVGVLKDSNEVEISVEKQKNKGRSKAKMNSPKESPTPSRKTRNAAAQAKNKGTDSKIKNNNTNELEKKVPVKKGRKTAVPTVSEDKENTIQKVKPVQTRSKMSPVTEEENKPVRTRRGAVAKSQDEDLNNKKKKETIDSSQSTTESTSRTRRTKSEAKTVAKSKDLAAVVKHSQPVQSRGRKTVVKIIETNTVTVHDTKLEISTSEQKDGETVTTRTVKSRKVLKMVTSVRGANRILDQQNKAISVGNEPETKRKRKDKNEMLPIEEAGKQITRAGKRARVADTAAPSPVRTRARSTNPGASRGKNSPKTVVVKRTRRARGR